MSQKPISPRCDAFTLIELLVVISIVAMLVAILLPALSKARESARVIQCQSHLKQFGVASSVYQHDYQSYFPAVFWKLASGVENQQFWQDEIQPYLGIPLAANTSAGLSDRKLTVWRCPTMLALRPPMLRNMSGVYNVDYSWNNWLGLHYYTDDWETYQGQTINKNDFRMKDANVFKASQTGLVLDAVINGSNPATRRMLQSEGNIYQLQTAMNGSGVGYFHNNATASENMGSLNLAYVDGHVKNHAVKTVKAGWFKPGKWWSDGSISRNSPIGG